MARYEIKSIVGENCITKEGGQTIYESIFPDLNNGLSVELDFQGCAIFASLFFNSAIGKLLAHFKSDRLNELLDIKNLSEDGRSVLLRVINNAKKYYSDDEMRKAQDQAVNEEMEE